LNWKSEKYYKQQAVISPDNMIYIKSNETIDAVTTQGNLIWSYNLQNQGEYAQYIISDSKGNLYFFNTDTLSLDKSGNKNSFFFTNEFIDS
jgi:hypothetical protein